MQFLLSVISTMTQEYRYTKGWVPYLDEVDLMLGAEGFHQLDVHGLVTVGREDTQMGLAPKDRPGSGGVQFAPTTFKLG